MRFIKLFIIFTIWAVMVTNASAQNSKSVWTIDFVKVKNSQLDSAVLALQKNWGAARKFAKKMKFVKSYQLLIVNQNVKESSEFDILLVTEYPDKKRYEAREENFKVVFAKHLPDYVLVNGKKPKDYAEIKFDLVFEGEIPFMLEKK